MESNISVVIEQLNSNLELLLSKNKALKNRIEMLEKTTSELQNKVTERETTILQLKKQNDSLSLAKALISVDGGVKAAKAKVKSIMREIDKCLALLDN